MTERERDPLEAAREQLEAARRAYEEAREAAREARRTARDADRERRREERHAHRTLHGTAAFIGGPRLGFDLGDALGGEEHTEDVERAFSVQGMPTLRVRNVLGDTRIAVGAAGEVRVRARKRVRVSSADRAKRLFENIEVRTEQRGDEIEVQPHLYEQDRGWLGLFKVGRVAVDFEITVPRECRVDAHTVSGDLSIEGTRGPTEAQSVSGEIRVVDVRGPLRLKSVSGDVHAVEVAGQLEGNSVSGELTFERARLRDAEIVTVSGEIRVDGELAAGDHRVKTVSGDVTLTLVGDSYHVAYKSMSGSFQDRIGADVIHEGKRERVVRIGEGAARVVVKTVSGDLALRRGGPDGTADLPPADETAPMETSPTAEGADDDDVRSLLDRVARGELSVEDAAAELDRARPS
ncbi:MAG TPA: DUF4097 family beta strand repeat-containing protein [Candidatus Limnocylindrales bacterium]|nr:DUF4097 family beta strand repeat-containing protein [Candidatus Limnocylindrales bacterium]